MRGIEGVQAGVWGTVGVHRGRRDRGRGRGREAGDGALRCACLAWLARLGRESATRRACTWHVEQVRCHGNGPTEPEGKAAPLARRRLVEQRIPLQRQLTEEYGRARLHGARASCRGALSHPTECSNASGWLTAPRLEVLVSRPVAAAGASIRQLKIGLASARCCSAEEHTTPCTHGAPYGHVLAAPGGARRPPEPNTTIGSEG